MELGGTELFGSSISMYTAELVSSLVSKLVQFKGVLATLSPLLIPLSWTLGFLYLKYQIKTAIAIKAHASNIDTKIITIWRLPSSGFGNSKIF